MKRHLVLGAVVLVGLGGYAADLFADEQEALKAFATVQKVFQSPRCQEVLGSGCSRFKHHDESGEH